MTLFFVGVLIALSCMEYELIKLNTARNCLKYIIRAFQIKELYIPYYLCPVIKNSAVKEGCRVKFYHIDINFRPLIEFPADSYILYPDYFGVCTDIVSGLEKKYKNLIVDNSHAFYSKPKGIACFNSLRKFFPELRNGAFLYTLKSIDSDIQKDGYFYEQKELTFEGICRNEQMLDKEDVKYMSDYTYNYFLSLDLSEQKQKRIETFNFYHNKLSGRNRLKFCLKDNSVPFKYPYLAENEDIAQVFASECGKRNVAVYRYWNNFPGSYPEKTFYKCLLAISLEG